MVGEVYRKFYIGNELEVLCIDEAFGFTLDIGGTEYFIDWNEDEEGNPNEIGIDQIVNGEKEFYAVINYKDLPGGNANLDLEEKVALYITTE